MNKPAKTLTRFFATVALVSGLVACGSGDTTLPSDGNENPTTLNVTLTSPATVTTKTGTIGRNYLDLAAPWTDWSGETSRVIYDSTANELIIPAPARGNDMVLGVQRYDMKLGTRRYSLNIDSASADVAAFIFVFNDRGELLALDASNGPFVAQPGQPFHFDAPPNSAGFYVQVQSGWQVNDPASIRPRLTDIGNLLGDNLIDPRGPWTDWDGNAAKVSYNGLINRLVIQGPEADEPVNYGIQRLTGTLTSGQTYELSVKSGSTIGSSVLLFLVDRRSNRRHTPLANSYRRIQR